jgi:hypothetical protein
VRAGAAAARVGLAVTVAAGGVALMACGCQRADERAAIVDRLRSRGTADVVREAATARYAAPAAGRLTEAQVRMFLEVRERECGIREAAALAAQRLREAAAADEPALAAAADLRAAQELRVNPKEYSWVRDRVLEAEGAATAQALYQKMTAGRELLLAHRRKELEAMTDPGERAAAQRDIEDWKRGLEASEPAVPAALRANMALLARFREPLARLRAVEERALAASAGLEPAAPAGAGR